MLDGFKGIIGAIENLGSARVTEHYKSMTSDLSLLIDRDCLDQTAYIDFEDRMGKSSGYSVFSAWYKTLSVLVYVALNTNVVYSIAEDISL